MGNEPVRRCWRSGGTRYPPGATSPAHKAGTRSDCARVLVVAARGAKGGGFSSERRRRRMTRGGGGGGGDEGGKGGSGHNGDKPKARAAPEPHPILYPRLPGHVLAITNPPPGSARGCSHGRKGLPAELLESLRRTHAMCVLLHPCSHPPPTSSFASIPFHHRPKLGPTQSSDPFRSPSPCTVHRTAALHQLPRGTAPTIFLCWKQK